MDENISPDGSSEIELPFLCRAMVDASPMPTAFLGGNRHVIRYVNPAFCQLVGEPPQGLLGELFSEALPGSSKCLALLDRVYRSGRAETHTTAKEEEPHRLYWSYVMWPVVSATRRRVGTMIQVTETTPLHEQTVAINQALMIGSVRQHELTEAADDLNAQLQAEIVQRKQAEKEIAASERLFRGLIEALPQLVWTATPDGTLKFANSKWFECFGMNLEEFNGAGSSLTLHPEDAQHSLDAWNNGLTSARPFQIEHRLRNLRTGTFRWYLTRVVPIRTEDEGIIEWLGTSTDIDDHKRAEAHFFTKQRLESLGLLAGGVAHDFNNLLTVILGGASLVQRSLELSDPLQATIGDIVNASERAAHLTRQMLAYAGKGRFVIEPIDINELVRSTAALIKASLPRSVRLAIETEGQLPLVQADLGQTEQIIMNLVMNAAEAIDESIGGLVTVKTCVIDITSEAIAQINLITGTLASRTYVVVEVQDTGAGMDEGTRDKILEPFFSTKFTGRGLGLSAVSGILLSQDGSLEVQSTLGQGSVFRVYLPASVSSARPVRKAEERRRKQGKETLLVVDDEEMVRNIARRGLEGSGFTVILADGGEEALRILQRGEEPPISLVLLDLSMPVMSGRQVMQAIRVLGIEVPILICSGYSEAEVSLEFAGLNVSGIILKPFTIQQLASRVQAILSPSYKIA